MVVDARTEEAVQHIPIETAWHGMAWSQDERKLYVSGGNATGKNTHYRAPIYIFDYHDGRLSEKPTCKLEESIGMPDPYWSGRAHHPKRAVLYAANMGTGTGQGDIVVFDAASGKLLARVPVEMRPYELAISADGSRLCASNWASESVSVIDTESLKVVGTIPVGPNPNAMILSGDGRLFVSRANVNTVAVVDTKERRVVERISTALTPRSPEGSTPNAVAFDRARHRLFIANADNNDVAVIDVKERDESKVLGFVPSGWYPSALALAGGDKKLDIGNSKGGVSHTDIYGPDSMTATSPGSGLAPGEIVSLFGVWGHRRE